MSPDTRWRHIDCSRMGWPGYTLKTKLTRRGQVFMPTDCGSAHVPVGVSCYHMQLWNSDGDLAHEMMVEIDDGTQPQHVLHRMTELLTVMRAEVEEGEG